MMPQIGRMLRGGVTRQLVQKTSSLKQRTGLFAVCIKLRAFQMSSLLLYLRLYLRIFGGRNLSLSLFSFRQAM